MVPVVLIFHFYIMITLMLSYGKGILKENVKKPRKKSSGTCGLVSSCWPPCPNCPHGGNFFSCFYFTNTWTYTQDLYLEILVKPHFFHYAFMAKRNTRCCALCDNILQEKEWGEKFKEEKGERERMGENIKIKQ